MERDPSEATVTYGSFSLLWPIFLLLCLSHFVEVLSCALQGRTVSTEAGMSIFEHSLAFSEAESMTSSSIGLGLGPILEGNGYSRGNGGSPASGSSADGTPAILAHLTRSQVLERMNVTPELLLILLISCCNGLWTNMMDVLGKQSRYRLASTSVWGFCYMAAMVWGLLGRSPFVSGTAILRFPTVCIVGFVPHLLILLGIVLCMGIYALALTITAFSMPMDRPASLRERFAVAHQNMQGASQIGDIRLSRYEDFYAALLRVGYTALTAASEAVFLNEGGAVVARNMSWLEEERLTEIQASRDTSAAANRGKQADMGDTNPLRWESGYNREKKLEKAKSGSRSVQTQTEYGVGAFRGATRFYQGLSFFRRIFFLFLQWIACGLSAALDKIGIVARPQFIKAIIVRPRKDGFLAQNNGSPSELLDFWILNDSGEFELPNTHEFDVEMEMRKREFAGAAITSGGWRQADEQQLDDELYSWWKAGGSWGDQDRSPDYTLPEDGDFDDTTSVISATSTSDWESHNSDDYEDDLGGRRTPTQKNPYPHHAHSHNRHFLHEESLFDPTNLARLLDPQDNESRQEGRILAAHLAAEGDGRTMTRSQYRKRVEREKARVLLSSRFLLDRSHGTRKPTPDEEVEILEKLILSRRADSAASDWRGDGQSWASGAQGLGPDGPPCVICHTNPRSIIAWPCRCLCICEDCRVSLAMNNFGSCVTCRQDVGGFLRLWVP